MLEMRPGEAADDMRAIAERFCAARASGDFAALAAVFEPRVEAAMIAAHSQGQNVKTASRSDAGDCTPGRVWYIGGSRRAIEVRYAGFSDQIDLWLSGQGRASDITYGDGGPTLKKVLGVTP